MSGKTQKRILDTETTDAFTVKSVLMHWLARGNFYVYETLMNDREFGTEVLTKIWEIQDKHFDVVEQVDHGGEVIVTLCKKGQNTPIKAKKKGCVTALAPKPDLRVENHHCHAKGCKTKCDPEKLMCSMHWGMVPQNLQKKVWQSYRKGQCDDMNPSEAWHIAADNAINYVAAKEGKPTNPGKGNIDFSTPFDDVRCCSCNVVIHEQKGQWYNKSNGQLFCFGADRPECKHTPDPRSIVNNKASNLQQQADKDQVSNYSKEDLRLMVKSQLIPIAQALELKEDWTRLSPDIIRSKILEAQGQEYAVGEMFTCDITGVATDTYVSIPDDSAGDKTPRDLLLVHPRVKAFLDAGWTLKQLLENPGVVFAD